MKKEPFSGTLHRCWLTGMFLWAIFCQLTVEGQSALPVISSIYPQGTNVVVTAVVPQGVLRVTLESRPRLGSGSWAPAAVKETDGAGGNISFTIACSRSTELLRIRADSKLALPRAFYRGTNEFWSGPSSFARSPWEVMDAGGDPSSRTESREVVESDIWKISGDTLFFFNQYRGLQVIDISDADRPSIKGVLDLAAAGEQMYLIATNQVVLLARQGCGSYTDGSQVMIVAVTNGVPTITKSLTVPGYIQESRMVGTALYIASQSYRPVSGTTNSTWEWGTTVSSFDLEDPYQPLVRDTLWYAGYGSVVSATDTYLFVVTQDPTNWWQSYVQVVDITSPSGTMSHYGSIRSGGQIQDKFKIHYSGSILTTISEDWRRLNGAPLLTRLETFHLPHPASAGPGGISKLGQLELGKGERLHATRFDGNKAYVVTFFQIDPLWIVDLSDAAAPKIAGELEVPGWSTYIYPMGDRLASVGVVSNRVAVSLFDVKDPSKPGILSRVLLGQNYSWTEANSDEKAFTVLEAPGMILVPYSGDTTNGWASRVQIIDLATDTLVKRGIVEHAFQPRRSTFTHSRILSISGQELLSVDATDRDNPSVRASLELSWQVDQVLLYGPYLLQITTQPGWTATEKKPTIRVSLAESPERILTQTELRALPVTGAAISDGKLFVAQQVMQYEITTNKPDPNFFLTIGDLAELPKLSVLGEASAAISQTGWGDKWKAHWPKPGVLVWAGGGADGYWWPWVAYRGWFDGPVGIWPGWGWSGGHLLAFDVSNASKPGLLSETNLRSEDRFQFSEAFDAGPLVYLSHSMSELVTNSTTTNWVERHYLNVVDYTDPVNPTLRKHANLPGSLAGLSHDGELLYTTGTHWTTNQDWAEWLDASAYDGVTAHLVASLKLSESWPHPVKIVGTNVFVGNAAYSSGTNANSHSLQTWSLDDSGKFLLTSTIKMEEPVSSFWYRDGLLAAASYSSAILLLDTRNDPVPLATDKLDGCFWFDLTPADGDVTRGLWLPLGAYGVERINISH